MPDQLYPHVAEDLSAVIDALVAAGVDRQTAVDIANSDAGWKNVDDRHRWDWIQSTAARETQTSHEAQQAANRSNAGQTIADATTSDGDRMVLTFAKEMGFYDGVPGSANLAAPERAAISEYQRRRGLPVTGEVDQRTYLDAQKLGNDLAAMANQKPGAAPAAAAAAPGVGGPTSHPVTAADEATYRQGHGQAPAAAPPAATPGAGGGGAAVATTSSGALTTSSSTGLGAPNPDGLFSIPGGSEIWLVDGKDWYAVYRIPGKGTPLAWKIEDQADLQAIFGPGKTPTPTRTLNGMEAAGEGPLVFGSSRLLANTSEHPFDAFVANFNTEARTRPWIRDPEILALTTRAILENRTVTDAELAGTHWWQTHTAGERDWMAEYNSDPTTARQKVQDGRDEVRRLLTQSGVYEPPETLVTWLGDRMTAGTWSKAYVYGQIAKIADPYAPGAIDKDLQPLLSSLPTIESQAHNVSKVDTLLRQWLGPVFSSTWTKDQKETWAGRLRNDPTAEQTLVGELKRSRLALFPEYTDPTLSYEDISAPWRGVWTQTWGAAPDETDPLFSKVVRMNDLAAAQETLRTEGLKRGIGQVTTSLVSAIGQSDLGQTVRRVA